MTDFSNFETDVELVEEEDSGIWLSIGDLMSGLLMFFVLLFITVQVQLQNKVNEYDQIFKDIPEIIRKALEKQIGGSGIVEVDPETGDVSINDRILFDEGSAELKPEGKEFLKEFIPIYSYVIFSHELLESQVTRVVIEGHTSSKGSDKQNMELSLRRALSVSDYIFDQRLNFPTKERFKEKILASGRGEIDADRQTDNPSDRKVVFRFQLRRVNFKEFLEGQNTLQKSLDKSQK